jgi:hypothetical protein
MPAIIGRIVLVTVMRLSVERRAAAGMRPCSGNRTTQRNPIPLSGAFYTQIPYELTWDRICATGMRSRPQTA